jgi:hypothetical protein
MIKVWLLNILVGVPHICVRMFVNASLVLLVICISCFCVVFKYKGSAAKIFIGYVRLLFVKFSGIPGCLWNPGCYNVPGLLDHVE